MEKAYHQIRKLAKIHDDPVYIVIIIDAIISILLILGLSIISLIKKAKRTNIFIFAFNLIIMSGIKNISYTLNWVIDNELLYKNNFLCKMQSTLMVVPSISQEFWVSSITLTCYLTIVKGKSLDQKFNNKFLLFSFLINDLVPIVIIVIYHILDVLGQNYLYCWIKPNVGPACAIIQYVLKWSSILLNIYLTIRIVITLNRISGVDELETKKLKSLATRMLSFPLIQLLAAILLTIYRLFDLKVLGKPVVICGSLQGILYPLCFGWNIDVVYTFCGCCCKKSEDIDPLVIPDNYSLREMSLNIISEL